MLRTTDECEQMNIVYDALDALQPSADELRTLWKEAVQIALRGDEDDFRWAQLFVYQLVEYIRRRTEYQNG